MPELKCPECGAPMVLRKSKYGPFYGCTRYPDCRAAHGAHPNGEPLGVPADKETKLKRIEAHAAFDRLWKERGMRRHKAYLHMQKIMEMTGKEAHIGKFNKEQCEKLIRLLREEEEQCRLL